MQLHFSFHTATILRTPTHSATSLGTPRGLVTIFRVSSVTSLPQRDKIAGKRAVRSLFQAVLYLSLCHILSLPPWLAFLAWTWPYLLVVALQLPSLGLLCSVCWHAARQHLNRDQAHVKTAWHVAFPSTCFKNQTSLLSYRKKLHHLH